jgi:hypothetical protein
MKKTGTDQSEGGKARAAKLSSEERSEIARAGARAKWAKEGVKIKTTPKAIYGSADKPLRLANIEIPCYVLDDGRRVLVRRGVVHALDMKEGTAAKGGGDRLSKFVDTKALSSFVSPELAHMIMQPIVFIVAGKQAYGYEATILADLCDAVLAARKAGTLNYQQAHIAEQCEILVRGFARVGIIALVDEATGYIEFKRKQDYAEIIEKFISKELRPWVRRFPFEFYEKIFRLKGWDTSELTPNSPKPLEVGKITTNIWKRLAPGVHAELKRLTPRNEKGYLTSKLHQRLTDEIGNPKLEKHIAVTMALMDVSADWPHFMSNLNKVLPVFGKNYELPLPDPAPTLALPASSASSSTETAQSLPSFG